MSEGEHANDQRGTTWTRRSRTQRLRSAGPHPTRSRRRPPRTPLRALDAPGGNVPDDPYQQPPVPAPAYALVPTYGRADGAGAVRVRPVTGAAVVGQVPDHGRAAPAPPAARGRLRGRPPYAGNIAIGLAQLLGFFFGAFLVLFLVGILVVPGILDLDRRRRDVLLAAGGKGRLAELAVTRIAGRTP